MEFAAGIVIGLLAGAVLFLLFEYARRRSRPKMAHTRAGALLNAEERKFHEAARRALAPEFEIFAKVGLADLLQPSPAASAGKRRRAVELLRAEHADFVVCAPGDGQVLGVIEFDAGREGHHSDSAHCDEVFESAGLPVLRVERRREYNAASLRQQALATFRPPLRAARLRVLPRRGTVWLRVDGPGTFQNSPAIRAYTERMFGEGNRSFAFDLQGCELMDSTFLGTLTGLALRVREDPRGRVGFARANSRVEALFVRYGLERVLAFQGFEAAPPAPEEMEDLVVEASREDKRGALVEAHEALVASSPENKERFGEALEFLKRKEPE